jgi:Flp pilus assembly protein TadD
MATACEYNLPEAEREYQLASARGPNDATAHQIYACGYLVQLGRFEEANRETRCSFSSFHAFLSGRARRTRNADAC